MWGRRTFIQATVICISSGLGVIGDRGVAVEIGYVLTGISGAFDKERPPLNWKSAQWLPVYLIGMGIISWQGQFSGGAVKAPINTNHIPFGWDMLVVAAFALVIYYWARAVRLPREEMLALVERQAAPEMEEAPTAAG